MEIVWEQTTEGFSGARIIRAQVNVKIRGRRPSIERVVTHGELLLDRFAIDRVADEIFQDLRALVALLPYGYAEDEILG